MSKKEQRDRTNSLAQPHHWCVRGFEPNPVLWHNIKDIEATYNARPPPRANVRFVPAAISNRTSDAVPQTIVQYAANESWASSATTFPWSDIHSVGPPVVRQQVMNLPSVDLRDVIRSMLREKSDAEIAIRLDIEGGEYAVLESLVDEPQLLCSIKFLFIEYHHLHVNLTQRGYREGIKDRIHAVMEDRTCKLEIQWRSLWASCGDEQRFMWRKQVKDRADAESGGEK